MKKKAKPIYDVNANEEEGGEEGEEEEEEEAAEEEKAQGKWFTQISHRCVFNASLLALPPKRGFSVYHLPSFFVIPDQIRLRRVT